ncbi:MAG: dipicolinate synthase subunit DpsA [Eubacteriales bacterium]|nr:dipicolinate synthase subunit DpsA [Eubacteriales bacterium]
MERSFDFVVAGGDLRMQYLVDILRGRGFFVEGLFFGNELLSSGDIFSKNLILPVPVINNQGHLTAPLYDGLISPVKVIGMINGVKNVFGGVVPDEVNTFCVDRRIKCIDYMKYEPLVIKNAQATAEGALKLAIENTPYALCSKKVLISGCGRIGKFVAKYLKTIGAEVTISARRQEHFSWISSMGYMPLDVNHLSDNVGQFDVIINTVPSVIFDNVVLENMKDDVVYIELASPPYGIDTQMAIKRGINIVKGNGLPGKTAPHTAAEAIAEAVLNTLKEGEV